MPVQVRDQALGMAGEGLPQSDAGKEYALQRMATEGELDRSQFDTAKPNELLMKLRRTEPYYQVRAAVVAASCAGAQQRCSAEEGRMVPVVGPT